MEAFIRRLPQAERNDDGIRPVLSRESASERAPKRLKRGDTEDLASEESRGSSAEDDAAKRGEDGGEAPGDEEQLQRKGTTDVENVLPPTQTDDSAIEEYELMRASQTGPDGNGTTGNARPQWVRAKSSIYVDAFNLALDTVLEDKAHLFDAKEDGRVPAVEGLGLRGAVPVCSAVYAQGGGVASDQPPGILRRCRGPASSQSPGRHLPSGA